MTVIPLGRALPHGSSHLPADSVGHVVVCLLGVAPRRDWPFDPSVAGRLVSVPLILASRRTGVTRYAALWSPDFPLCDWCGTATVWLASPRHFTLWAGYLAQNATPSYIHPCACIDGTSPRSAMWRRVVSDAAAALLLKQRIRRKAERPTPP